MNRRLGLISVFLVLATLGAASSPAVSSSLVENRKKARLLYKAARKKHSRLASKPEKARTRKEYRSVILAFHRVRRADPTYGNIPPSLLAIADLYREMGDLYSAAKYYRSAIKTLQFLTQQYPHSRSARRATYKMGEIYHAKLHDFDSARRAFQRYLKRNPRSPHRTQVKEKLREMELSAAQATEQKPAPAREAKRTDTGPLVQVTGIRHWVGANYTRVVIGTEREVKFRAERLENPDRIFFDFYHSHPSSELKGQTLAIGEGYLKQIRVGQPGPEITRVVLDVTDVGEYSVYSLPNPFRIIVDMRGKANGADGRRPRQVAKSRKGPADSGPPVLAGNRSSRSESPARRKARAGQQKRGETVATGSSPVSRTPKEGSRNKPRRAPAPQAKAALPTAAGKQTMTRALGLKIARIVIDPGHGGHDTGTIGPSGLSEKDLVLDVAHRLKKIIEKKLESQVVLTRETDTYVSLEERPAIANRNTADLFISLHANASGQRWVRGVETYYLSFTASPEALKVAARENAYSQESVSQLENLVKKIALTEKIQESQEFAREVQSSVYRTLRKVSWQKNRGVKKAPFVVLIGAKMPAVLAEISFLSNPKDERLLKRSRHRQKIAEALFGGIAKYVKNLGGVTLARRVPAKNPELSNF